MFARYSCVALLTVLSVAANSTADDFDSDGVKLHYTVMGEGEPVLLLHGYTANGSLNWKLPGTVRLLAEDFQVIVMDVRGHGHSDPAEEYGVEMVHDAVRLLDHLNIEDAHVAGYSMGGMITLKMLTMYPERIRSAAVCGMGWYDESPRPSRGGGSGRGAGNPVKEAVGASFHELSTTEAEIKAIKVPTVAIVGEKDVGQRARVDRWKEVRPDLSVVLVPEADHVSCVFKEELRSAIRDFFVKQSIRQN